MGLFADGAAVRTVGSETFRVCKDLVDDMVTVSTDEVFPNVSTGVEFGSTTLLARARNIFVRTVLACGRSRSARR